MKLKPLTLLLSLLSTYTIAANTVTQNPLEASLKAEGALVTLPVETAKEPFEPSFIDAARRGFNNFHWQMGGDHSMYYNMYMNEFMPTALASPNELYKPLKRNINPELDKLLVNTKSQGQMTMKDYLAHPQFRTQGFMLVHKGVVVYEAYHGMRPTDRHVWASSAKTTVGLIVAQLVSEGKVNVNKPVTVYVPELEGTVWDEISVLDVLNHTTALDNEETLESILNRDSPVVRFFASAFGSPRFSTGEVENWLDVARDTRKIKGEQPSTRFRYASMNTIVLTKMVENIENATFTRIFEDRVWGKTTARQPILFNQTPDGMAIAVGLVLSTLEDKARFGALFTPSWEAVATEPVVSPDVLKIIQTSGDPKTHENTTKQASSVSAFNEMTSSQSYQFDYIFDDGAIGKSGNLGQFIYIDPTRDFVGVMFSNNPYHSGYGENKGPALMRAAAKKLADK